MEAKRYGLMALAVALVFTGAVLAQGTQTGTLEGSVRLDDGSAVPGVTVTATSPALQGTRTAYPGEPGNWSMRNLPPGPYEIALEGRGGVTLVLAAGAPATVTLP